MQFVDEAPLTSEGALQYEIIYGNPEQFLKPRFEFPVYNVPLMRENWPKVGTKVAQISASSPSRSALEYKLYSADDKSNNYFVINSQTGK